jgi:hypothetical protein
VYDILKIKEIINIIKIILSLILLFLNTIYVHKDRKQKIILAWRQYYIYRMLSYSNKFSKFMNIILFLKDNIYIETFKLNN